MRKYLFSLGVGIGLVLALVNVESRAADDDITKELDKISKDATAKKWDDLVKETAGTAGKYDSEQIMHLMAKRNPANDKGGVGVGAKPGAVNPDGIEAKIINMRRNGLAPGEIAGNQDDFKKMADQIAAIAAVTINHKPRDNKADPGGAIWKRSSQEMYDKSKDFAKAVAAKNNVAIKKAAEQLDGSCKACHAVYRP